MGIGGSIFLIVAGAILTLALHLRVGWLDLDLVGWIMVGAGLLGLIVTTWIWGGRRREVVTRSPAGSRPFRTVVRPLGCAAAAARGARTPRRAGARR
jgi:Domain of unknown function (DUF6458)